MKRQYRRWIVISGLCLGVLILLIWFYIHPSNNSERKDFIQLLTQIIGGMILLASLFFTWRNLKITHEIASNNLRNAQETLRISQEGQITDRFTKAVEQMGKEDNLPARLGGIYALQRIARDSERDHWPIMEILTSFVREIAKTDDNPEKEEEEISTEPPRPDIQAILTVIGRRVRTYDRGEYEPLYLASTDLRNTYLQRAHLEGAVLWSANLAGAVLWEAHLEESRLTVTDLTNANLKEVHFEGAMLSHTRLDSADLSGAFFSGATVDVASFEGANLLGTHFEGVDLRNATGLTWQQIKEAHIDEETKLPAQLEKHRHVKKLSGASRNRAN